MTRRRPPLAERRAVTPVGDTVPGVLPSHLVRSPVGGPEPALALRLGGDGVVLGVDRHGGPLGVRLFRPAATRIVFVGSPRGAQLVAFRVLATGADVVVGTARPATWNPIAALGVPVRSADSAPGTGRRTRPLLHVDDAPPHDRPPKLPDARWTTVLTLRDALTHRDVELVERADLLLVQSLTPAEADVLTSARRLPQRIPVPPPDVLTVVHARGVRWGRLAVTPVEQHYLGQVLRR